MRNTEFEVRWDVWRRFFFSKVEAVRFAKGLPLDAAPRVLEWGSWVYRLGTC